jgi:hypothetical protein
MGIYIEAIIRVDICREVEEGWQVCRERKEIVWIEKRRIEKEKALVKK